MTHLHRSQISSSYDKQSHLNLKIDTKSVVNFLKTFSLSLGIFKFNNTYFGDIFLGLNLAIQKAKVAKTISALMEKVSIDLLE